MVFLLGFALLLHLFIWGAGTAIFAMPRAWKKFWPVLALPTGAALQALVVWLAAYAGLPGTSRYAWGAEIIPLAILFFVTRRRGLGTVLRELQKFTAVGGVMGAALFALLWPFTKAAREITTFSLGSCDAADYAAGARTLMEFSRSDRSGFLGLTEVVRVMSVDNFFDFWLRLNHFTPAAIIALNASLFGFKSYQITGVVTAVLLAASIPVVFWLARSALKIRGSASLWVSAVYGFSPITWYAVYQVAMGQLLAAIGIGVITWAAVALWRIGPARRGQEFFFPFLIGYLLVLGSYNFILSVALVPAATFSLGLALYRREWKKWCSWLGWLLLPLGVAGVLLATRVAGLAERFALLGQYDFGWKIPALGPEGWLGAVAEVNLEKYPGALGAGLATLIGTLILGGLYGAVRRKPAVAWTALAFTLPIFGGYFFLEWRGAHYGTNASYDAYKLFAVFYPGILAACCLWVAGLGSRFPRVRGATAAAMLLVTIAAGVSAWRFEKKMRTPPLVVTPALAELQSLEQLPNIKSVNLHIPDMWSRLWANDFLLRRPQYFLTHTYEGRLNTPLRGEWDLHGGLLEVQLPGDGSRAVNAQFSLSDTRSNFFIRAGLGSGWYDLETLPRSAVQWRWAQPIATIELENPQSRALEVAITLDARSLVPSQFTLSLAGAQLGAFAVGVDRKIISAGQFMIPPGKSVLSLADATRPSPAHPGDARDLALAAYHITVRVVR